MERIMNYYDLKSVIGAGKVTFKIKTHSESFYIAQERDKPYIKPSFTKVFFEERPPIILISAVGATGKTTLAQVLSNKTGLPLLDLAKHKPVGASTLTGLLTSSFDVSELSEIFKGIGEGHFGVILDGIDEGRSKTTQKAFEAFLDDIVQLSSHPSNTSFLLLGRTQILDDCFLYLSSKGINPALITISPFDLEQAREYIDCFSDGIGSAHESEYIEARDYILARLSAVFDNKTEEKDDSFLSFIGYPPVLDAIVTLLKEEKNWHRLLTGIKSSESQDIEITLLHRIAQYILQREKEKKVIPNILEPLLAGLPPQKSQEISEKTFETEEQCMRLVSFCLGRQLNLNRISENSINERYEAQLATFLPEHPFVQGHQFRNAIFESVALAILMTSREPQCKEILVDYATKHKHSYYLVYLLSTIHPGGDLPIYCLDLLVDSALEFHSSNSSVEVHVDSADQESVNDNTKQNTTIDIDIDILLGKNKAISKNFCFHSHVDNSSKLNLGSRLSSTYISVPCEIAFTSNQELDFTAPIDINSSKIVINSKGLILRNAPDSSQNYVLLQAKNVQSALETIITNGVPLTLEVSDFSGLEYPTIQYAERKDQLPSDPQLRQKYLRLKRILLEFRSHARGTMARYKNKIENEHVLSNNGRTVLARLLKDGILSLSGDFYYLERAEIDKQLGVSWLDLKKDHMSPKLLEYLRSIT
jgi:hypothetical protein